MNVWSLLKTLKKVLAESPKLRQKYPTWGSETLMGKKGFFLNLGKMGLRINLRMVKLLNNPRHSCRNQQNSRINQKK